MRTSRRSGTFVAVSRPLGAGMTIGKPPKGLLEFGLLGLTDATSKAGDGSGCFSCAHTPIAVRPSPTSASA